MAARPCHIALTGCPGVDSPITNISAEAPDPLLFWGVPWNPYDPYRPPPLGNGQYVIEDCPGWFTSLIAQFDPVVYAQTQLWANLQALALQLGCDFPQVGDLTFQNDAQTATVHCPDGSAFSYTVDAGTITATFADPELGAAWVLAANAWALAYAFEQASALLQCGVGDPHIPHIPGDDPPDFPRGPGILENPSWMCFGENYVDNYTITGGSIITNYTMSVISGAIPPGTVFTQTGPRAANITGVVTAPGQYTWTIQAVSTSIPTLTVTFQDSLWVMGITNASSLPDAQVGVPYSEVLLGIGGTAPYTFALDSGSTLPPGFSLASDGTVSSDDPTAEGDFTFDVVITDAHGGQCTDTVLLPIVGPPFVAYQVCSYASVVTNIAGAVAGCSFQFSLSFWTGLFDQFITSTLPGNYPIWYFINAILDNIIQKQVSADQVAGYPVAGWQDAGPYTRLAWNGTNWQLIFACTAQPGPAFMWVGDGPTSLSNAAGVYTRNGPKSLAANPSCITVAGVNNLGLPLEFCPFCNCTAIQNISSLTWSNVHPPNGDSSMTMIGGDGFGYANDPFDGSIGAGSEMQSVSFCVNSVDGYDITMEIDVHGDNGDGSATALFQVDGVPAGASWTHGAGVYSETHQWSKHLTQGNHTVRFGFSCSQGATLGASIVIDAIRVRPLTP